MGLTTSEKTSEFGGNRILAMGDINNDKLTDIVTVDDEQKQFQVWLYDSQDQIFRMLATPTKVGDSETITSIFVGKDQRKDVSSSY